MTDTGRTLAQRVSLQGATARPRIVTKPKVVSMQERKAIRHRIPNKQERKLVIYYKDHQWRYDFTGQWNAHLLQKVARGLKRGYIRSKRGSINRTTLRGEEKVDIMCIPKERPNEDLGVNPKADVLPIQIRQPEMPLHEGVVPPVLAPLKAPDAASMQPHTKTKTEENKNVSR